MPEFPAPVFIHSLFRSGSTYVFDVFRKSPSGYWCYQEPENELLLQLALSPKDPISDNRLANILLRHPKLDQPYFAEFMPIRHQIANVFRKRFPFDTYFLPHKDEEPDLRSYIELLIDSAQGRPMMQFCRSSGRMEWFRNNFKAQNIFLWRKPRDQWWSYKVTPYFNTANLLILNARYVPPVFEEIRNMLQFKQYHDPSLQREFAYFEGHGLNAADSYFLFFSLWYHAMHEGHCDEQVVISMDALSSSKPYRLETLDRLTSVGVDGINFDSCKVPNYQFLDFDAAFFAPIEERVFQLFRTHGYDDSVPQITKNLYSLKMSSKNSNEKSDMEELLKLSHKNVSELIVIKQINWYQQMEIERLTLIECELSSIYNSIAWKIIAPVLQLFWRSRTIIRNFKKRRENNSSTL